MNENYRFIISQLKISILNVFNTQLNVVHYLPVSGVVARLDTSDLAIVC